MTQPDDAATAAHPDLDTLADLAADAPLDAQVRTAAQAHVGNCDACSARLAALADLPTVLANASVEPMPASVAQALQVTLRHAVDERADGTRSGTVVPLASRRRRWVPALVAAAAAVVAVGAISLAQPWNNNGAGPTAATTPATNSMAGALQPSGPGLTGSGAVPAFALTSAGFAAEVRTEIYHRPAAAATGTPTDKTPDPRVALPHFLAAEVRTACSAASSTTSGQQRPILSGPPQLWNVTFDGQPAVLVSSGPVADRVVTAYQCGSGHPAVLATVVLDLR
ncbi:MAG: hypothetical protein ACRDP1_02945 [Nocardioidaceae bacterium]